MKIGFTGTHKGMSPFQTNRIEAFLTSALQNHDAINIANEGDCVGADASFANIARNTGTYVVHAYPASDTGNHRAFFPADYVHSAKPALERNRDIVDASDVMLATPFGFKEQFRGSGTWAAIRHTKKIGKELHIFWPDGSISVTGVKPRIKID